ncbi:MAG: SagB/ThcOx family dehydrogenase [Pseudomonadota bacterium]
MIRFKLGVVLIGALCVAGCQGENGDCKCDTGTIGGKDTGMDTGNKSDGGAKTAAQVLTDLLQNRRSANAYPGSPSFSDKPLTKEDLTSLAWAAQGINDPDKPTGRPDAKGLRTAPSAGALYPIELYVSVDKVDGLAPGLYWYRPEENKLEPTAKTGALSAVIAQAALGQQVLEQAAAIFVVTAVGARTAQKYGNRAETYIHMEAGHLAQNIHLMSTARNLDSRPVAGFTYANMTAALNLPADHVPCYLIPVGNKPE